MRWSTCVLIVSSAVLTSGYGAWGQTAVDTSSYRMRQGPSAIDTLQQLQQIELQRQQIELQRMQIEQQRSQMEQSRQAAQEQWLARQSQLQAKQKADWIKQRQRDELAAKQAKPKS